MFYGGKYGCFYCGPDCFKCFKCLEHFICPTCKRIIHSYNHKKKVNGVMYCRACGIEAERTYNMYLLSLNEEKEFYKQGFE